MFRKRSVPVPLTSALTVTALALRAITTSLLATGLLAVVAAALLSSSLLTVASALLSTGLLTVAATLLSTIGLMSVAIPLAMVFFVVGERIGHRTHSHDARQNTSPGISRALL